MKFKPENLNTVLSSIEENLRFRREDMSEISDWDLRIELNVRDIIAKAPSESENIKYIISVLNLLGYISFSHNNCSLIDGLTINGLKFLLSNLHNIEFI